MSYFYKTESPKVLAAVCAWAQKKAAWDIQRKKLGEAFGADASPMYSGSRNYVGGIKLSASADLDVHWRRPDEHGYRALRSSAKHAKGITKEARALEKAKHERLLEQWKEHCPADIDSDEMWEGVGVERGNVWFFGGVCFEHDGAVYLQLGAASSADQVEGLVEVLGSEYQAARQNVMSARKAA
ncbi:hypothetical protein [Pseudomonas sp. ESBL1]|uniref:hypothetical protein n=1 Tax=Pseudomonas sp. ESBL1 TaxID=3077324 RepID=UPI002FCAD8FE